jgi:hypothetical protein
MNKPENKIKILNTILPALYFGFEFKGQQMDEIDGAENIYEMSASDFVSKWGRS